MSILCSLVLGRVLLWRCCSTSPGARGLSLADELPVNEAPLSFSPPNWDQRALETTLEASHGCI